MQRKQVIVLGDSFNNTLGLVRSLGQAGAEVILILVGHDRLFVSKSRYVSNTIRVEKLDDCTSVLNKLSDRYHGALLVCTNDKAAQWVDNNEDWLHNIFKTPMDGRQLGQLFEKSSQCRLAGKYGICIPKSVIYNRGTAFPDEIPFPILMKPADSNHGEKSDIHICHSIEEVENALQTDSKCNSFIVQEYIDKEFEINMIGISTQSGVVIPGGIRKIRHYPTLYSPCSYGKFKSAEELGIDIRPIEEMIQSTGYRGPFSIEFLRKDGRNYFMEINFRHDGLAYAATASGVNLMEMYLKGKPMRYHVHPTYMMDLSTDYCHVKDGNITKKKWFKDFLRTGCQLNFNRKDPMPTVWYYLQKLGFVKR